MGSIFGKMAKASRSGARLPFVGKPGINFTTLRRYRHFEKDGIPVFQADFDVQYVIGTNMTSKVEKWNLEQDPSKRCPTVPHQPGEAVTERVSLDPGQMFDQRVSDAKGLTLAVLESVIDGDYSMLEPLMGISAESEDDLEPEDFEKIIEALSEGDGTNFAGAACVMTASPRINKAGTGSYVIAAYEAGNQQGRELLKEGKIEAKAAGVVAQFVAAEGNPGGE